MNELNPRDWDMFRDIAAINLWLDAKNMAIPDDDPMRVMKISEEIMEAYEVLASIAMANGRAATAYIGMTGQNPRKGVTHYRSDLCLELADVAITALCALAHFTGNNPDTIRAYVAAKIGRIMSRADVPKASQEAELLRRAAARHTGWSMDE